MNILSRDRQTDIIAALTEGCSIRSVERLTGVHRDTIMRLGHDVGVGCAKLHNALVRDVRVNRIELDEIWQYVGKKRNQVRPSDPLSVGDQWTFIALGGASTRFSQRSPSTQNRQGCGKTFTYVAFFRARHGPQWASKLLLDGRT